MTHLGVLGEIEGKVVGGLRIKKRPGRVTDAEGQLCMVRHVFFFSFCACFYLPTV